MLEFVQLVPRIIHIVQIHELNAHQVAILLEIVDPPISSPTHNHSTAVSTNFVGTTLAIAVVSTPLI